MMKRKIYSVICAVMLTKDRKYPAKVYWIFAEGGIEHKIYEVVKTKKDYTLAYFTKDFIR